ncbi:tRNA (adenine(58)-N(1))-methyltransferase, mitochondrial isoform X1 [Nerophis lumbriciformis]|uniref:tRNA (adenine(58)-N(1))-methyltransferase, mitochondrial isoform X1 n=1 Tax=Nerophis lumbriciformis TaxID=546530 RepID=UPI002ADF1A24|nr:tRNA (adenine(58)-N(1))-methyltransferase, mitochondrial-like isoform X1 [Nerophis lumbriciformis]
MASIGFFMLYRLTRIATAMPGYHKNKGIFMRIHSSTMDIQRFSTGCLKCNNDSRYNSDPSLLNTQLVSKLSRKRSLSPLERVSSLLPQDVLSPEVTQLREQCQPLEEDVCMQKEHADILSTQEQGTVLDSRDESLFKQHDSDASDEWDVHAQLDTSKTPLSAKQCMSPTLPRETTLSYGEQLVAIYHGKKHAEFRKMFQLQTGARLNSNLGVVLHDDIAGHPAGHFQKSNRGFPIFIRRASLDEYVLSMKRGPAICYPKDANTMLMMMDVTEGDCVLESGTGSGAMSLFLSRAVGSIGSVLSIDVRQDHLKQAMLNYQRWRASWRARRGEDWPDNVQFHNADLCTAMSLLAGQAFNAVALDLLNPHLVLPTVISHLHPGGVCAVYLANITQVIDLLEGIRCSALPLLCERIFEIPFRDWLVAPALHKDGQYCLRKAAVSKKDQKEEDTSDQAGQVAEEHPAFGSIPYIARPHPAQFNHTAFLVKLRKFVR